MLIIYIICYLQHRALNIIPVAYTAYKVGDKLYVHISCIYYLTLESYVLCCCMLYYTISCYTQERYKLYKDISNIRNVCISYVRNVYVYIAVHMHVRDCGHAFT